MTLVEEREQGIHPSLLRRFSDAPLVNAAISIYQGRAAALGIPLGSKVNLPAPLQVEETDKKERGCE